MRGFFRVDRRIVIAFVTTIVISGAPVFSGINHGLVAFFPFEGNAQDQSGNGNHGTEHGWITYGAGAVNLAGLFDGVNDYVEVPRIIEGDFTVVFWVRTLATGPNGTEWWQGLGMVDAEVCGSPPGGDWGIALLNGGHVQWGGAVTGVTSSTEVNDGAWYSVAVTRDSDLGEVEVFVNGTEEDTQAAGWVGPLTGPPWIGVANNPCDVQFNRLWFPGDIDELRFYERVLSPFEIWALSQDFVFFDDFESGDLTAWSSTVQ